MATAFAARRPLQVVDDIAAESTSLGLKTIWKKFANGEKPRILDLGPARQAKVEYFQLQRSCQLRFNDLSEVVVRVHRNRLKQASTSRKKSKKKQQGIELERLNLSDHMHCARDAQFDLILAWDFVNYLSRPQIAELARELGHYCCKGTLLHVFVANTATMPKKPAEFSILENNRVKLDSDDEVVASPRHAPTAIMSSMGKFQVMHMYQLANGYHEHLYEFRP